ncbi:MAG: hypothetical protein RL701_7582 [Pseudomonadota bacterium]|jgi:hypothetical protein
MSSLVDTSSESSVIFNLRQLMQLESEREQREAHASECARLAVAQREEESRRRHQCETRLREQQAAEAAQQAETARQVALLRVRLEAEARQQSEHARLAASQEGKMKTQQRGVLMRRVGWVAALLLTAAGGAAFWAETQRELALAHASVRSAAQLAAEQAHELTALRSRLAAAAVTVTSHTPTVAASVVSAPAARNLRRRVPRHETEPRRSSDDLRGSSLEGVGDTNDPIEGL